MKTNKKFSGFTLIEMLTAMAIILLMGAILFPVLFQAKGKAKETVCISNLRQIYVAMQLYREEWGEYSNDAWGLFEPYKSLSKILTCPKYKVPEVGEAIEPYRLVAGLRDSPYSEKVMKCRAFRGESKPIVIDYNHAILPSNPIMIQDGMPVIILRESGTISTMLRPTWPRTWAPGVEENCDGNSSWWY